MDADVNGVQEAKTPPLFMSLIHDLQQREEGGCDVRDADVSVTGAARRELEEWWRTAPFTTTPPATRADYQRFYEQLFRLVQGHGAAEGRLGDKDFSSSVGEWVAADWPRDQRALEDREAFVTSVLMVLLLVQTSTSGSASSTTLVSLISSLRQACQTSQAPAQEAVSQPANDAKPRTMAEKLAQMRERRSTMIKEGSIASISKATTPAATTDTDVNASTAVGSALAATNDDAAHLFTIETRLELKETLRGLQTRLDALLLETKLAWMKCFASEEQLEPSISGLDSATQIVTQGEALASHLLDAFTMARSPKCPIAEYKALVATCETEMASFQALVSSMASAPSPVKQNASEAKITTMAENRRVVSDPPEEPRRQPLPVEFDLPSMKAYYAKAAPSYTAYLPKKTAQRR